LRRAMLAIGAVIGFLVLGALLLDEGEVVTLFTQEAGREHRTHMWIVEVDGREFVRANRSDSNWLARLKANPEVRLRRSVSPHGPSGLYWARLVEDPDTQVQVDAAFAGKYRFADRVGRRLSEGEGSQAVELTPRSEPAEATKGKNAQPGAGS
jgi:hypothetical protein